MIPEHILFSIASFLNFTFILDHFPNHFKTFASNNKIELLDSNDLEKLIQYDRNIYIKHLVYHFKPSEEDNDKMDNWLLEHNIQGDLIEIPFIWKGRQLIQISCICNRFEQCIVNVYGKSRYFSWNINVLGNVFSSMKNKHCSFILNGGRLDQPIDSYHAGIIQSLTLNNVSINPNYNIALLKSKVGKFFII